MTLVTSAVRRSARLAAVDPTGDDVRRVLGRLAAGVTVVTSRSGSRMQGMTCSAFSRVSQKPPLVLAAIHRTARLLELLDEEPVFAASVLSEEQEATARWFANPDRPAGRDQFAAAGWATAPISGCPLLRDSLALLDCRVQDTHLAGDHVIVIGRVLALGWVEVGSPLVHFRGSFHGLARDPLAPLPDMSQP
ncbi:MAG: flavin reductase family protein [Pseudonocardiaceae bacterium]